jgi:hypothetical protein
MNMIPETATPESPTDSIRPRTNFRAIATDIHFWIPLVVLLGGLILLDKVR